MLRRGSNDIAVSPEIEIKSPIHIPLNISECLPVDAHEEVGEETFIETQLAALFNVRKADDGECHKGECFDSRCHTHRSKPDGWTERGLHMDKSLTEG